MSHDAMVPTSESGREKGEPRHRCITCGAPFKVHESDRYCSIVCALKHERGRLNKVAEHGGYR